MAVSATTGECRESEHDDDGSFCESCDGGVMLMTVAFKFAVMLRVMLMVVAVTGKNGRDDDVDVDDSGREEHYADVSDSARYEGLMSKAVIVMM